MDTLDEARRKRIRWMPLLRLTDAIAPTIDPLIRRFNVWARQRDLPMQIYPAHHWYVMFKGGPLGRPFRWTGRFRNPKRWGGHVLGLEFGRRG